MITRSAGALAILVAAAPGFAQAGAPPYPPDIAPVRQIVPGSSIGPWTLAMGIAGLRQALGAPAAAAPRPMFDQQPGWTGYAWTVPDGTLTAWARDGKTIGYLELRDSRAYRTSKLVGVGSTNLDVEAAYGPAPARTAIPGASRYIYDAFGLAVFTQGTSSGFVAVAVAVFPPMTAAKFWKF